MQKIASLIVAACCLLLSETLYAQQLNANISGTVKDNTGLQIPAATISLLRATDSTWVKSELADEKGSFNIKAVLPGNYIVTTTSLGYGNSSQHVSINESEQKSLAIVLQKNSTSLKEVTVNGKKPFLETGLGKIIINPDASIMSAGTNVLELLRKAPGVFVDAKGNISMSGKQGVMVLINDRPTYLSADQLAEYLKGMSSDEVAQLELITQPSAKYDAEGNAGIINIKTKKNKRQGFNGMATLSFSQGVYSYNQNTFLLNYNRKKLALAMTYTYITGSSFADWKQSENFIDLATREVTSNVLWHSHPIENYSKNNLKLGADYAWSEKTKTGVSIAGNYHTNSMNTNITSVTTDYTNNNITNNDQYNTEGFIRKTIVGNAYVKHTFNKESDAEVNIDYLLYAMHKHQDINSFYFNEQILPLSAPLFERSMLPYMTNVYSLKADYTTTVLTGIKIETGLKSSAVTIDNNAIYNMFDNSAWMPDTLLTNHFLYHENINALYVNANKKWGTKWQLQLGLRLENTFTEGQQLIGNQQFTRNSTSLFPNAFLSYKQNDDHQFELNFGRRIERPDYWLLNPFKFYSFQYNYSVGNPSLLPQYSNNVELKHSYKSILITTLSYSHTSNVISDVTVANDTTKVIYSTSKNIASGNFINLTANFNKQIYKWWTMSLSGNAFYIDYIGGFNNNTAFVAGTGYSFYMDNQFNFEKKWNAECQVYYGGKMTQSITSISLPTQYMSFGVSKKVLQDTGTIKLQVSDPFYLSSYRSKETWNNYTTSSTFLNNSRLCTVSFAYNFGHKTESNHKENDITNEAKRAGM